MLQLPCRLPVTSTLRVKIRLCQKCLPWKASRRGQFDLPEGFHSGPLFFDATTASGHFLIAIGRRNVAQRLCCEHERLIERPHALSPHKNRAARTDASRPFSWLSRYSNNWHRSPTSQIAHPADRGAWTSPLGRSPRLPLPPGAVARRLRGARSGTGRAI